MKKIIVFWAYFGIITVSTAILEVCPASAQTFRMIGSGVSSCGTWTTDRKDIDPTAKSLDESWVLGFLAGIGDSTELNPLNGLDANAVVLWIDDYCKQHPLDTILKASEMLVKAHPH